MSDIVRRDHYLPDGPIGRIDRTTMKMLGALKGAALIGEAHEVVVARQAERRLVEGERLTKRGMFAAASLHHLGTVLSRDDPGLELDLRAWEQAFAIGGQETILRFMTRPS